MRSLFLRIGIAGAITLLRPCPARTQETASDLIFSHRRHLARPGIQCADCHASAVESTAAADDNLPKESSCLRCHDGAAASKECALCHRKPQGARAHTSPQRVYRFNHKLHLSFGNMAPAFAAAIDAGRYLVPSGAVRPLLNTGNSCLACHRGVPETDLATEKHLPQMADCLVCHTRIDPPLSCRYCHTADAVLKPAGHTANFADVHSSRQTVPDKTTCKVCHGLKFTCMGCH